MSVREPCVLIVDDDESVRDALSFLMTSMGLSAKTYDSAKAFLTEYDPDWPGCIVLDVRMPGMSGLALQQTLIEQKALHPVIFITGHGDIPMAVEAVKNGAMDFLTKPFRDQDLLDSINTALELDAERRSEQKRSDSVLHRIESLTQREREVLDLVVTGKANKVIATELCLSPRTVEVHRAHMMDKMQAATLADLVKLMQLV